jgi:Tol biopolymer transport system component
MPDLLEGASRAVDLEPGDFERLLRRRERKQRTRRIQAGVLGVLVALVAGAILARAVLSDDTIPVDPPKPPLIGAHVLEGMGASLIVRDPDTGEVRTIVDGESQFPEADVSISSAAWSPSRHWVAFRLGGGSGDGSLWVADTVGGAPRQVATAGGYTSWSWSPTEDELVVARGNDVIRIDAATGDQTDLGQVQISRDQGDAVSSLVWSPDGTRIAYEGGEDAPGTIYTIDVATRKHEVLVPQPAGAGDISIIDWSPDGEHLAIWYYDDEYIESPEGQRNPVAYKARALYIAKADGSDVHLVAHIVGDPNGWYAASPAQNSGAAWSPDGTRLAYAAHVGTSPNWRTVELQVWTVPTDGSAPTMVASECCPADGGAPVWSPDGTQIAVEIEPIGDRAHDFLLVDADGTGSRRQVDEMTYRSWQGGWFWCACYG